MTRILFYMDASMHVHTRLMMSNDDVKTDVYVSNSRESSFFVAETS